MEQALISLLATDGPIFCEIIISEMVEMMPLVASVRLVDGSFKSSKLNEMSPTIEDNEILDISNYQE